MIFHHYIKTTLRNLRRSQLFSLINIFGLAIGMSACLLILHYVKFEKSYDTFHSSSERIYRMRYERTSEDGTAVRFASCTPPAADFIRGQYPEVERIARIVRHRAVVSHKDSDLKFTEDRMYFAEPDFFKIFEFPFFEIDPSIGISKPSTAFISRSTARKYFGDADPLGKVITVDAHTDYSITGVFKDIPANSHLKFDIVLSFENLRSMYGPEVMESWGHTTFFTYILFKPGTDPVAFENQMIDLVAASCGELMRIYKVLIELKLQPLEDIHLTSHFLQEYEINGSRTSVDFLGLAALFIILMAWINYVNLTTAHALTRSREVSLRKVVGASRSQIMMQFFFETTILNLIALAFSIALVQLALPAFSYLAGLPENFSIWHLPWFWISAAGLFLLGVVVSGSYPIAAISGFEPIKVFRGHLGGNLRGISMRKSLVVFQFVIAFILLAGALTVYRQILHMKTTDLGFDRDQVLVVKSPRVRDELFVNKFAAFKDVMLANSDIQKISAVTEVPGRQIFWDAGAILRAGEDQGKGKNYMIVGIDYDFIDVFKLRLLHGRNFSREFTTDTKALILNETAVRWMGFDSSEEAVGQQVDYWGEIYAIVGVLSDYHQQSPKSAFEPQIYRLFPNGRGGRGQYALKLDTADIKKTVEYIGSQYQIFFPGNPFEYYFLDDYYDQQYRADELFGKVIGIFAILAVFVTGLGIFGMSSFLSLQRTREIGIRKVLGASVLNILGHLARDFVILIMMALVFACPLVYWGIQRWLGSFADRMPLSVLIFLIPVTLIFVITLLTISANIIRAATADPVSALKHE